MAAVSRWPLDVLSSLLISSAPSVLHAFAMIEHILLMAAVSRWPLDVLSSPIILKAPLYRYVVPLCCASRLASPPLRLLAHPTTLQCPCGLSLTVHGVAGGRAAERAARQPQPASHRLGRQRRDGNIRVRRVDAMCHEETRCAQPRQVRWALFRGECVLLHDATVVMWRFQATLFSFFRLALYPHVESTR